MVEKEKGDAFELLISSALELHPLYATKLEEVRHHAAVPFAVHEHLGIPLKDYGIDIVARTFEGNYQAVQAKYRSERDDFFARFNARLRGRKCHGPTSTIRSPRRRCILLMLTRHAESSSVLAFRKDAHRLVDGRCLECPPYHHC